MKDFIAELRSELVGAAERQASSARGRTRKPSPRGDVHGRPVGGPAGRKRRSARRRTAGAWRIAGPVIALAAIVAATVIGTGWLRGDQANETPALPSRPQIMATFKLPGKPAGAVAASDEKAPHMWVLRENGGLIAVDRTGDRTGRIPINELGNGLAATDGYLWITYSPNTAGFGRHHHSLLRVDPASGQRVRVRGLEHLTGLPPLLAGGLDALWLQPDLPGTAQAPLTRVDAGPARVSGAYASPQLAAITVTADRVWTIDRDGRLEWRDPDTGTVIGRRGGFESLPDLVTVDWLAPAPDGGVLVSTGLDGKVTRVGPDGKRVWSTDVDANGPMTVAAGSVWATAISPADASPPLIVRLDARTGRLTEKLPLNDDTNVRALVGAGDEVWAVFADGTVIVLR